MQYGADPQMGLSVSSVVRGNALVVQVQGELDYRSASILRTELSGVWEKPGISAIVLDLAEVVFCDSVGLSELIAALRRSQTTDHALMVSGVHGTLLRVLTITGLRNAFDTYDTVESALSHAPAAVEPATPPVVEPSAAPSPLGPPAMPTLLEPAAASVLEPAAASVLEPAAAPGLEPAAASAVLDHAAVMPEGHEAGAVAPRPDDGAPPEAITTP
jgi:anti-sigma B factor antagonist